MQWKRKKTRVAYRGKETTYTDFESEDGKWLIMEGLDEAERKAGKPFLLLQVKDPAKGVPQIRIDAFPTILEAQQWAEVLA